MTRKHVISESASVFFMDSFGYFNRICAVIGSRDSEIAPTVELIDVQIAKVLLNASCYVWGCLSHSLSVRLIRLGILDAGAQGAPYKLPAKLSQKIRQIGFSKDYLAVGVLTNLHHSSQICLKYRHSVGCSFRFFTRLLVITAFLECAIGTHGTSLWKMCCAFL